VIHHEPKSHAATEVPDRLTAAQRWILFAASLAVGLAFLDETAVVTALRTIQRQFGASDSEVQWVMGSYLLALASLMAATGRIADLYGRRRLFIVGAALFGLGSLACAAAPSEEVLIASRALQGAGGALVIPLGMANATGALPEEHRGWVIGIVSMGATVFLALGPLIGGGLVELVGWRWIFLVNVPLVVTIIVIAVRFLPESRAEEREPLDVTGFALLVGGLVCLTIALLNLQDWGPRALVTLSVLAAAVVLLTGFVAVEHRSEHPLINLKLLRIPTVSGSLCALFAIQFAILGLTVYLTLYLQNVLGYSPALAGALTLPTVAAAPLLAAAVGRRTDREGTRLLTSGSMLLASVALVCIALLAAHRQVALLLPAFLVFGIARPVATVAGTVGTVGAIPRAARGLATALVTEARQLGAVMGVAVLGLVLTGLEIARRRELLTGVDSNFGQRRRAALDGILANSSHAQRLLQAVPAARRGEVRDAAASAFISGFRAAMLLAAVLAVAASVVSWRLLKPTAEPADEPIDVAVAAQ
jgi:EmrB/QacA subfamily drug resistance transporter